MTWTTSDDSIVKIHDASTGLFKTVKNAKGQAIITATNEQGESQSCVVTVAFDGESISGGDFEYALARHNRWNSVIKAGTGEVVVDPDNPSNNVLALTSKSTSPSANFLSSVTVNPGQRYKLSFDVKGVDADSAIFWVQKANATIESANVELDGGGAGSWQYLTTKKNEWTTFEYVIKIADNPNRNYLFGFTNVNTDQLLYFDNVSLTALGTAESISLSETEIELDPGEKTNLTVTASPEGATMNRVQWITSDANVATVENGEITAIGGGTATITAVSGTLVATMTVSVTGASILPPDENAEGYAGKIDFDHAAVGFPTMKNENYVLDGVGVDGTKGFMVSGNVGDYVDIAADANIMMLPGESYIVRFQTKGGSMRLEFGPQGTYAQIPLTETHGNPSEYTPSNAEWTTYQRIITATTSTRFYTWLRVKFNCDNAPVYIDNIEIFKVDDLMAEMGSFDFEEGRYGLTALEDIAAAGDIVTDPTNAEDTTDRVLSFPKKSDSETAPYATLENKVVYLDLATSRRQVGSFEAGRPYTLTMDVYGAAMGVFFDPSLSVTVIESNAEKGEGAWYQVGGDATKEGWKTYTFTFYAADTAKVFDKLFAFAKNTDAAADYSDVTAATYIDNVTLTAKEVDPETLVLNSTELLMGLDNTSKLTVTPTPAYATVGKLTWTSSNEAVATVKNGTVTAVAVGTATITVTMGELSASCVVTVVDEAVSFTLASDTLYLAPGASKTPTLVTVPANTKPGAVTWTSDNTAVATVDAATGKVTAVAAGKAVITGKKGDVTVTCTVTVDEYGERITGGDFEMNDWNNGTFTANIIKDGVGTVIDDEGNMVLSLPGSANSALYLNGLLLEDGRDYRLTFKAKGTKVSTTVNGDNVVNGAGETATTLKANEWTTVTVSFTYKAGGDKNAVIALSNQGGSGKTLTIDDISLVQLPKASGIAIVPGTVELLPGTTNPLKWSAVPSDAYISDSGIRWTSSDPSVISVDEATGMVTALGKDGQTAEITVTNGTFSKTVTATITDYANLLWNGDFEQGASVNWGNNAKIKPGIGKDGGYAIELTATGDNYFKGDIPAKPGTKYTLSWDYLPVKGAKFKVWSSKLGIGNNSGSASGTGWQTKTTVFTTPAAMDLSSVGWIIAIVGEAMGTEGAVIVDNLSIRLYTSGVEAEKIEMSKSTMTLMPGRTGSLALSATPVNGDVNRVTWTSSNEDVATVEYGVVTGVGYGTATITATLKSGLKATCKVNVSGNEAFIINGTFSDTEDDSWIFSETGATIVPERGVLDSNAASLTANGSIKQDITGLKPETKYQIFVRFRSDKSGKLVVDLSNADTVLYNKTVSSVAGWTKGIYEFTTDANVSETDVFTLTIAPDAGQAGPIYVDNILVAEQAQMIDFVVEDVFWLLDDPMAATDQVKPGEELTFYVLIKNQGTDAVKAGDAIVIDICMDGKPVLSLPYTFALGMEAGAYETVAAAETWAAVAGDHVMSARVNATLSILEIDDTNNNTQQKDLRVNDVILTPPEVAELAGFNELIFSDDFNTTDTFDTLATGGDGYKWYVKRPWDNKDRVQHIGEDYSVENGVLTLHSVVPTYNYTLGTQDLDTQLGFEWQYGYMEIRFRIPRARENTAEEDGAPAIWSLPPSKLHAKDDGNLNWVEMDWMEYWGINGMDTNRPEGFYTISIHDTYKVDGTTMGQYKNSGYSKSGLGDEEWHTMGWLWQKGVIISYLDGEEVMRQTFGEGEIPDPWPSVVENKDGTYQMTGAFSHLDEEALALFFGGSKDNPLEVDYVRIWGGSGDGVIPSDPDEEGEIVDMAAEDFWYNYCTDDWGDPIVSANEDNYLNILAGQEVWEKLSDERKAEINAYLTSLGQATYDELLADALIIAAGGVPGGDEADPSPDTGEHTAVPAVAALAALSAAAVWITRKRKKHHA